VFCHQTILSNVKNKSNYISKEFTIVVKHHAIIMFFKIASNDMTKALQISTYLTKLKKKIYDKETQK